MIMRQRLLLALLVAGLLSAGVVRAADPKAEKITKVKVTVDHKEIPYDLSKKEDVEAVKAHLESGKLEKLVVHKDVNLMELRWDTALWTIVVFLLLFLILKKLAWGPMLEGLQKREDNIQAALVEAKEARAEA